MNLRLLILFAFVMMILIGKPLFFHASKTNQNDYAAYVKDTSGVDVQDLVESSRGNLITSDGEPYGIIELTLSVSASEDDLAALLARMDHALGERDEDMNQFPSSRQDEILDALKQKQVLAKYTVFTSGRRAKTRVISIYIACDEVGKLYFYQFG